MTLSAAGEQETKVNRQVTWTQQGSMLQMKWKGFDKTAGTVENGRFTMTKEGVVYIYER